MRRSDLDRCQDILAAIAKIERYRAKLAGEDAEMAFDAIVRQFEIIGEAANGIDAETKARAPDIEWNKIVGLRNVAIHEYFRLDSSIIHGVTENYLPDLRIAVERIAGATR
ncbi:DUF86 domain-containing protein [Rhodococcus erythropolis]